MILLLVGHRVVSDGLQSLICSTSSKFVVVNLCGPHTGALGPRREFIEVAQYLKDVYVCVFGGDTDGGVFTGSGGTGQVTDCFQTKQVPSESKRVWSLLKRVHTHTHTVLCHSIWD